MIISDGASLILLPGLDGTGDLFQPFLEVVPSEIRRRVIRYPTEQPLSYDALLDLIDGELRDEQDMVLVGESFSGPLAIRLALLHPQRVRAVVLSASFVQSPIPRWICRLAKGFLFRVPLPNAALRFFLIGRSASDALVELAKRSIRRARPDVLAARVREIGNLECADDLRRCPVPILYLAATQDWVVRSPSVAAIRDIHPDVKIRPIAAHHMLLQGAPSAAWAEIAVFIAAIPRCNETDMQ